MKSAAMQNSMEGERNPPGTSASTLPKYCSTISVGTNRVRPSSEGAVTSPVQRRLSGELTQVLRERDGSPAGRGARARSVGHEDRKNLPVLIASRGQRENVLVTTLPRPFVRSPVYKSPTFTPSAKPPHPQAFTPPSKSETPAESRSPPFSSSGLTVLPPSNGGGSSAAASPVRMNGCSDGSVSSDNESCPVADLHASLPGALGQKFSSTLPRSFSPSTETSSSSEPLSVCPSPLAAASRLEKRDISPHAHADVPMPAPSPSPTHPVKTPDPQRPKSCHRKSRRAPRPPPMSGIAENGAYSEGQKPAENGHNVGDIPSESFHVSVKASALAAGTEEEGEGAVFAGRRDLRDARSLEEKQILSNRGTVRGLKNRVRAGVATFLDHGTKKHNYRAAEKGQIVMYLTSMTVVRDTYERCKAARNILYTHMVRFEQRDVYLSHQHQTQLRERLDSPHEVALPQVFIDGQHLGGALELEKLNESGELRKILHRFPKIQVRGLCEGCGGYRWVPCEVCHGSKKSLYRNHFTEEFTALRCTHCNENGLQRCLHCLHHTD